MIQSIIADVLKIHCDIINRRIVARWNNMQGIQGEARADPALVNIIGNMVFASMEFSGSKAFVAEYGRGSNMATSSENPYLNDYLRGDNFNQWRMHSSRMPIMGRSAGDYKDLDGKTQTSSGAMQGLDLERDGDPRFVPMLPQFIIKEEFEREYPDIIVSIQSAVASFAVSQLTMTTEVYL